MGFRDVEKFFVWDPANKRFKIQAWRREILPSWMYFTENDLVGDKVILGAAQAPPVHYVQPYYSLEGADANLGTPFLARGIVFEDSVDGTAAASNQPLSKTLNCAYAGFRDLLRLVSGRQPYYVPVVGRPDEFARVVLAVLATEMLNGEVIRLDGALRMPPA
jgi:hypothetical protein